MDAYFNVVSLRAVREYADRPIEDDVLRRILQAGRATGSSQNRQQWRFYATKSRSVLDALAATVWEPRNLEGCRAAIAVAVWSKDGFDAGRCAQNMMLAAWAGGIGSVPNGLKNPDPLTDILGLEEGQSVATILSLGYPAKPAPTAGDVESLLQRIKRKSLDELVVWVG